VSVVSWFSVCTVTFFRVPVNVKGGVYGDDTGVAPVLTHIERVVGRELDGDRSLEPAYRAGRNTSPQRSTSSSKPDATPIVAGRLVKVLDDLTLAVPADRRNAIKEWRQRLTQ
jgi:hypothetical protein